METFNSFFSLNMMPGSFIQSVGFPDGLNFLELQNIQDVAWHRSNSPQNYHSGPTTSESPKHETNSFDSSTTSETSDEESEQTTPDVRECCRICGRRTIINRKVHLFTQTGLSNRYQQRLSNAIRFICNDPSFTLPESADLSSFFCRKCSTKLISFEKAASNLREVFFQNPSSQKSHTSKPENRSKRFGPYNTHQKEQKEQKEQKHVIQSHLSPLSEVRIQNTLVDSIQDLQAFPEPTHKLLPVSFAFNQPSSVQPIESLGRMWAGYQDYGFTEIPLSAVALEEYQTCDFSY